MRVARKNLRGGEMLREREKKNKRVSNVFFRIPTRPIDAPRVRLVGQKDSGERHSTEHADVVDSPEMCRWSISVPLTSESAFVATYSQSSRLRF